VREETGFANLHVLASLGTLRGEYTLHGEHIQRDETYFLMRLLDDRRVQPGAYDDAAHDQLTFRPAWTPVAEAAARLSF
jgi:hypothetical protein